MFPTTFEHPRFVRKALAAVTCLGLGFVLGLGPLACDGGNAPKAAPAKLEAKAAEDLAKKARVEERRKKREADAKAKADAETEHQALLDSLCVAPKDELPKDLTKGCRAAADAHNAFMERVYADDEAALAKWKEAASSTGMTLNTCKKSGSLEVAACQKHALDNASPDLEGEATSLLRVCLDKYGKEQKGGVTPPE